MKQGFTLVELIIAVVIIGVLAAVGIFNYFQVVYKANYAQIIAETQQINHAIGIFRSEQGYFPKDGNRGAPGVGLKVGQDPNDDKSKFAAIMPVWPTPVCKDWFYDWENWDDPDIDYVSDTYRVSVRKISEPDDSIFFYCSSSDDPECIGENSTSPYTYGGGVEIRDLPIKKVTCRE